MPAALPALAPLPIITLPLLKVEAPLFKEMPPLELRTLLPVPMVRGPDAPLLLPVATER